MQFLSTAYLERYVPSVFTNSRATRTSERYQHISTLQIIEGLSQEGFYPVSAHQSRCQSSGNRNFAKHCVRFRHSEAKANALGLFPEIALINSHDGLSSYRLLSGIFRVVCCNGLVAGETFNEVRIRHQGDILKEVIEGTYEVIHSAQAMLDSAAEMSQLMLTQEQQIEFAQQVHAQRFKHSTSGLRFQPQHLLKVRRFEEMNQPDLFTTLNIIQENVTKGGVTALYRDQQGYVRRARLKPITNIDQNTRLNQKIWGLAEGIKNSA
ncbi:MAG: DUF945 domain-containing protein [Legionellales bacterium]|nr:DUF945 domain-containing protein [Legionellales bacterium]